MVLLQFHLEPTNADEALWWVESPQLPTLFVSAARLADCQRLALEALEEMDVKASDVRSVFAGQGRLIPRTARLVSLASVPRDPCSHGPIYRA